MNHPQLLAAQAALDSGKPHKAATILTHFVKDLRPLSPSANDALQVIHANPGINRTNIVRLCGWSKAAVNTSLAMLLRRGLVTSKTERVLRTDGRPRTVPTYYAQSPAK